MAVNFWPSLKYSVIEILLVKVADNLSSCVLAAVLANSRQFLASKQFSGRNRWPRRSGSLLLIFPFCYPEVVLSPAVVAWACLFLRSKGPETRRKGPGTHSADGFELSHPRGKDANDSGCFWQSSLYLCEKQEHCPSAPWEETQREKEQMGKCLILSIKTWHLSIL